MPFAAGKNGTLIIEFIDFAVQQAKQALANELFRNLETGCVHNGGG